MKAVYKPRYLYQAVHGAAVYGNPTSMYIARGRVDFIRPQHPDAEVERVEELPGNARRYWRWRSGKWSHATWSDPSTADLARWDEVPMALETAEIRETALSESREEFYK